MDLIAKHYFNQNITTRFTRIVPLTWSYDANIRIELYGCPGTLSYNVQNVREKWRKMRVHGAILEGRPKEFHLFTIITSVLHLPGCDYYNKRKRRKERQVIDSYIARAINTNRKDKAVKLDSFQASAAVSYILTKCSAFRLVCEYALGIEKGFFNVSASTYFGPGYEAWRGRLNHNEGFWRPLRNKDYEFLQFSFDAVLAITGLSIQGDSTSCGRVTRFYLHYSLDGKRFATYVDPVHKKVSKRLQMY